MGFIVVGFIVVGFIVGFYSSGFYSRGIKGWVYSSFFIRFYGRGL